MIFLNKLQVKIILPIIIAIIIIFSIMIYTVEKMERELFHEDWLAKTKIYTNSISAMIEKEMEGKRPFIVRDLIHKLKKIPGIKNLQVVRTNGKEAFEDFETFYKVKEIYQFSPDVIEEYMNIEEGKGDVVSDERLKDVLRDGKEREFYGYDKDGKVFYDYYLPILNKNECHKCHGEKEKIRGILKISLSDEKFAEHINNHLSIMIWISVATIIILITVIGWIVYNIVSRPLNAVIKTIKVIEHGDKNQRISLKSSDEIGYMARHFNIMLDRLKQESHLASLGRISAVLAHEIKNPIAGISGAIQLIDEDIPSDDPKREIINMIVKEVQRLDSMLKDLLRFSKPIDVNPKVHDLNKLITDTSSMLEFKCRKGKISIETNLDNNIPNILIDREKIQQVLLNICLNAVESMKENGRLTIETSTDKPGGGEYIQIDISDTGCGISPEVMKNIFTPFFTTKKDGSGLGLPISLRIVEKHKGTIKVESVVDKGSRFTIILPLDNSLNIVDDVAEYNNSEVL
jgi:signal transduction histidine kinase